MAEQSPPATVDDLLSRIKRARADLDGTLAGVPDSELTRRLGGGWSVKDHLAHLDSWHQILLMTLDGRPQEAVGMDRERYELLDLDELNAVIDSRNRDRPLDEVRQGFAGSYDEMVARISGLADADLAAPVSDEDSRPRIDKVIGDTYGHYREHQGWISELVGRLRS